MKRIDGKFYRINVAEYEEPLIIDAWHIVKVESKPFTEIIGLDSSAEIYQDAVVGIESGENMLWAKPYKKAPLRAAKRACRKLDYEIMTVSRRECNGKVISRAVKYIIYLKVRNLQGQSEIKTVFVHASGIFSEAIGSFNGVDGQYCTSPQKLEKHLKKELRMKGKDICVRKIESFYG